MIGGWWRCSLLVLAGLGCIWAHQDKPIHPYLADIFDLMQQEPPQVVHARSEVPDNQMLLQVLHPVTARPHGPTVSELDFDTDLSNTTEQPYAPSNFWNYRLVIHVPPTVNPTPLITIALRNAKATAEENLTEKSRTGSSFIELDIIPSKPTFSVHLNCQSPVQEDCQSILHPDNPIVMVFAGIEPIKWRPMPLTPNPVHLLERRRRQFLDYFMPKNDFDCQTRKKYVAFSGIGMPEVIRPVDMMFTYCQGKCPSPLPLTWAFFNTTNHAGLMDGFKLTRGNDAKTDYQKVNKLGCVPEKYYRLDITMRDSNGGEKVVRFNRLLVNTCQCA